MSSQKFSALPRDQQDAILDKYRHFNVEHTEWYESTYEWFTEDMEAIGIDVGRIYFTGFCSQGDGACFEGHVEDWPKFLKSLGIEDTMLANHFTGAATFSVKHSGFYYHEHCTSFSMDFQLPTDEYETEENFLYNYGTGCEVRDAVLIACLSKYDGNTLEAQFIEAFKDHMRTLYRRLEEEYDYLTSDERVLESLEANDLLEEAIEEVTESEV